MFIIDAVAYCVIKLLLWKSLLIIIGNQRACRAQTIEWSSLCEQLL